MTDAGDPAETESDERNPVEVLAEAFSEALRRGESPTIDEFCTRHPALADEIRELFPMLVAMEQVKSDTAPRSTSLPAELPFDRIGQYRLVREVGRGGMGIVFEAVQEALDRRVAVKILPGQAMLSPRRRERFLREARATARLHHTNIVPVFDVGVEGDYSFYVMQLIEGRGLDALIRKRARTGEADSDRDAGSTNVESEYWRRVATIGHQVAEALAYAHEQGILHRDIKPSNVLLDLQGNAWIADFGLAKIAFGGDSASDSAPMADLTLSGDVLGTLRYMAPEQREGRPSSASDVYGLGLTLYELLTLEPAYRSTRDLLDSSDRSPPSPRRINAHVPRDLDTIVVTATAARIEDRYPSARHLAEDLLRFLEERPILARPAGVLERGWRWCRRNPALATSSTVAGVALVSAAIIGWIGYGSTQAALSHESQARSEADENVRQSLIAFDQIFDALAPEQGWNTAITGRRRDAPPGGGPPGWRPAQRRRRPGDGSDPSTLRPGPRPADSREEESRARREAEVMTAILGFYDAFAERNATSPRQQEEAAHSYQRVAAIQERLGRSTDARTSRARATELFAGLMTSHPDHRSYREDWLASRVLAARFGDPSLDPLELLELRQEIARANEEPSGSGGSGRLLELEVQLLVECATRYTEARETGAASGCFEEALQLVDRLSGSTRLRPALGAEVAMAYAEALVALGEGEHALEVVRAARTGIRDQEVPPPPGLAGELDRAEAEVLEHLGRTEEATAVRRRSRNPGPRGG